MNEAIKNNEDRFFFENIRGESKEIKEAIEIAKRIAPTDVPVLLKGETGTGKKLFARAIYNAGSRKNFPFITINCSAISGDFEKEFFSRISNFPEISKGFYNDINLSTIFFDEIGEMNFTRQTKLLRAFETNFIVNPGDYKPAGVNVRIITATNKNIEKEIEKNNFRKELYYRIGVVKIEIPPLRKRRDDIEPLAEFFIRDFSKELNRTIKTIDKDFLDRLREYDFPGNVRELKNVIERAIILSDGESLKSSALPGEFFVHDMQGIPGNNLSEIEKYHILKILRQNNNNKTRTAETLGIGLTTLY